MKNIALIIAGGSGNRMHQDIPKQFLTVNERPVIVYTLEAFENHPEIDAIAVVCIEGWDQVLWAYAKQFNITKLQFVIPGGANGQGSIRNGVMELGAQYLLPAVMESVFFVCSAPEHCQYAEPFQLGKGKLQLAVMPLVVTL